MIYAELVETMEQNSKTIVSLFTGISIKQAIWRPTPEKWSLLEILNHLCDEEREDFRKRVAFTLEDPLQEWTPIDNEGWVTSRRYNEQDFGASLEDFKKERAASIVWLNSLDAPDWDKTHQHATIGPLRAGDLFAAWVAHDLLHIRQIANTAVAYISIKAAPYSTRYAG